MMFRDTTSVSTLLRAANVATAATVMVHHTTIPLPPQHVQLTWPRCMAVCAFALALAGTGECIAHSWMHAAPVDSNATYEPRNLLARLHWLRGQKLLFGHHETTRFRVNPLPPGEPRWSDLRDVTGEWPGLWSFQINFAVKYDDPDGMRREMHYAYSIGAPLTVCWHADNPVTGGGSGDTNIDFATILPGGSKHHLLVNALSNVATFLLAVTNAAGQPIPLLYRAWHEQNLVSSFWWNKATPEQFKEFWRFTVVYYRDVRGLHNLLYVFCPNWRAPMASGNIATNYLETYPGDEWVDVLGLDYYGDLTRAGVTNVLREMVRLGEERGKLATLTESGAHVNVQTWYNKPGQYWAPYATTNAAYPAFMAFANDDRTALGGALAELQIYQFVPEPLFAAPLLLAALVTANRPNRRVTAFAITLT